MKYGDGEVKRILVVDDDPSVAKLLGMALTAQGYEVFEALSGIRGYKLAKKEKPDLLLLDIMMPDIDGYEVYRRIKLDPVTRRIPVMFVSAKAGDKDVRKGLSMGAEGYITKPFELPYLLDTLDEFFGEE